MKQLLLSAALAFVLLSCGNSRTESTTTDTMNSINTAPGIDTSSPSTGTGMNSYYTDTSGAGGDTGLNANTRSDSAGGH